MNTARRPAIAALTVAGLLWGTTVPLSKLALEWLPPGWLTLVRFAVAAAILLVAARSGVRAAFRPGVLISGAIGYGGTVLLQNAGITRTSVSHAALLIGTTPVLVAVIAAVWQRSVAPPVAWVGFTVSLAGVGLVATGGGGGASLAGDGLVLASLLLSAGFTVAQTRLLAGQDPVAVTAVQFLAAAVAVTPAAALSGLPAAPASTGALLATMGLATVGTTLPFTLFAYGQSRMPAEVAGAFLNIEPLVGSVVGVVAFGDPAGLVQLAGGAAILGGIALSSIPLPVLARLRLRLAGRPAAAAGQQAALAEVPAWALPARSLPPEDAGLYQWLELGDPAADPLAGPARDGQPRDSDGWWHGGRWRRDGRRRGHREPGTRHRVAARHPVAARRPRGARRLAAGRPPAARRPAIRRPPAPPRPRDPLALPRPCRPRMPGGTPARLVGLGGLGRPGHRLGWAGARQPAGGTTASMRCGPGSASTRRS